MKLRNFLFALSLTAASACVVGCGDDNSGLSAEDKAWIKQKRIQEMYGINGTVSTTSTQTVWQTATITTTTVR